MTWTAPDYGFAAVCVLIMLAAFYFFRPQPQVVEVLRVEAAPCNYVERWGEMVNGSYRQVVACHEFEPRRGR